MVEWIISVKFNWMKKIVAKLLVEISFNLSLSLIYISNHGSYYSHSYGITIYDH